MNGKVKSMELGEFLLKLTVWDSGDMELSIAHPKIRQCFIFNSKEDVESLRRFLNQIKENEVEAK